jgi:hypothetical protein
VGKPIMNLDEVEFDDVEENGLHTSNRGQISREKTRTAAAIAARPGPEQRTR